MNIVIVGNGKVGFTLAEQLVNEDHDITLIDRDAEALRDAEEQLDIFCLTGNGAAFPVQMEANVPEADLMIAATSADEINILCCLLARKLGAQHTIARVRNPEYDRQLYMMKEELGLSMSINPERAAAVEISRLISFPSASSASSFVRGKANLIELKVEEGSILCGNTLSAIRSKFPYNILICAVERDDKVFIPGGNFIIEAGDSIHISGSHERITEFLNATGLAGRKIMLALIVGGGAISYYVAKMLLDIGIDVRIIERDKDRCNELAALLPDALIIHGDGTDRYLLSSEGIGEADAFIALTDIDEENLIVSMYAKKCGVPKVISKLNRLNFADVVKDMGIDSVISPKYITAQQIIQYVRAMQNTNGTEVKALYRIANNKAEVVEFLANSHTANLNTAFKDCRLVANTLIAALVRDGQVIIPHGNDCIMNNDGVIVVRTAGEPLYDLNEIFR